MKYNKKSRIWYNFNYIFKFSKVSMMILFWILQEIWIVDIVFDWFCKFGCGKMRCSLGMVMVVYDIIFGVYSIFCKI